MSEKENLVKQTLILLTGNAIRAGLTDFLIIGGNAVIAHGVPRFTQDVDFVIPDRLKTEWRNFLEREGFSFYHGTGAFQQFHDTNGGKPRVDLMLVDEATWQKLNGDAWSFEIGEQVTAPVASPMHIIAMKLTACRSEHRRDDAVDWIDILSLSRVHGFDPRVDAKFSDFVLKYGGKDLHKKLIDEI